MGSTQCCTEAFIIVGYLFVVPIEVKNTLDLRLLQCLFHMPHIMSRVIMAVEECYEWLNAFCNALLTVVVLEPKVVTCIAAMAKVLLENIPLQSRVGLVDAIPQSSY